MIKSLRLRNFESHKDTTVKFTEGFNLLVGLSNRGKTSLIKALRLIAEGVWVEKCVRVGATHCHLTCVTDKGRIDVKRGGGKNKWVIKYKKKKYSYSNVGKSVPKEVRKVLGFGKASIGGLDVGINLASQLEKHFLLSEIDGKSVRASTAAKIVDDLSGVSRVEELVDSIHSDRNECVAELKRIRSDLESEEGKKYDDAELAELEKSTRAVEKRHKVLVRLVEEKASLVTLSDKLKENRRLLSGKVADVDRLEGAVGLTSEMAKLEAMGTSCDMLTALASSVANNSRRIAESSEVLESRGELNVACDELSNLEAQAGMLRQLEELKESLVDVEKRLQRKSEEHVGVASRHRKMRKRLKNELRKRNMCPLSEGEFYPSCKERILDEAAIRR